MIVTFEEQQQRVTAELQQHPAVIVRDLDHHGEDAAEGFDQFLATFETPPAKPKIPIPSPLKTLSRNHPLMCDT